MAITNFAELKTAIHDWLEDRTDLAAYTGDFIALAEGYINSVLRVRDMEASATLAAVSGVATLPTDYLEWRSIATASPVRELSFIAPSAANYIYHAGASGVSKDFTIVGNTLTIYPLSTGDVTLIYIQKVPALSDAATTNWLLTARPELYLRASLMQAAEFIKEDEQAAKHKALTDMIASQMQATDTRAKYARSGVRLSMVTP